MDDRQYADLRGRLDAAEVVLVMMLRSAAIDLDGSSPLKAEILDYAAGLRRLADGNPLTVAQAEAMERYGEAVFSLK